jgi:glycosyltransferase involved in cell wall biosynthesis
LEREVARHGLQGIIRFLGWRDDLPDLVHAADCTVLPSVASENLSVAVLESLMAGTPALVTAVGGMAEAITNEVTGLVVPVADSEALGMAMVRFVSEPGLALRMRSAAAEDARSRFTRVRMMQEYVNVFSEAVHLAPRGC